MRASHAVEIPILGGKRTERGLESGAATTSDEGRSDRADEEGKVRFSGEGDAARLRRRRRRLFSPPAARRAHAPPTPFHPPLFDTLSIINCFSAEKGRKKEGPEASGL